MNYNNWMKVCERANKTKSLMSANDVHIKTLSLITDFNKEHFIVHGLNTKNKIIYSEIISIGTLNASIIHAREIFKKAIINSCNSIIIAHNHPSGDTEPSSEDREITKMLKKSGEILGISILDHVISGANIYYSFKEHEE